LSQYDTEGVVSAVECLRLKQHQSLGIFFGEENHPDLEELVGKLNQLGISFFGGIFPGLVHDEKSYSSGVLLTPFNTLTEPVIIPNAGHGPEVIPTIFSDLALENPEEIAFLVLVDGLYSRIGSFLKDLYHIVGPEVQYFGGGAGSLSLVSRPCLFNSKGVFQDAALVVCVQKAINFGVKHGWEILRGGLVASQTQGNRLQEINWENAFSVYQSIVEEDSINSFESDNFFEIAKGYPFGLLREGSEHIIRDPIARNEEGELICVADIPENASVAIMKGEPQNLINAAREAAEICLQSKGGAERFEYKNDFEIWVIDCISRAIYLEDRFKEELNAVADIARQNGTTKPLKGILTLGEISSSGNGTVEFLNKTIVVGAFNV